MNSEICEKLSALCGAVFTVGTASAAGLPFLAVGAATVALTTPSLWRSYRAWSDCPEKRAIKTAANKALQNWRDSGTQNHDIPTHAIAPAEAAVSGVIDLIVIDPNAMKDVEWDAGAIPGILLAAAASSSTQEFSESAADPQAAHNRTLFLMLANTVVAAQMAQRGFEAKVMPAFRRDVMSEFAQLKEGQEAIGKKQDAHTAMLEELLRRVPLTAEAKRAEEAGVSETTIIVLAQQYSSKVDNIDTALAEIANAIEVAIEVRQDASRGHNFGSELDEIFKRLEQLTGEGKFQEAAQEADREIAAWEELQAEAAARGIALLEAGIRQDTLNRDAAAIARKLIRKAELKLPAGISLFDHLRAVQDEWYVRGRDKGLNLDLEVSIHLARRCIELAQSAAERGAGLNDVGISLQTLGERESSTERLEEAVATYRAALKERTRERVPLDWAMTQNNLGAALKALGEREAGTERFEEAIAAYRAALDEWTRERVPLRWAGLQNNLGNALSILGKRETGTDRLEEAVAAYRDALKERTRDRVPLQWATTQNNLGNALATLGARETGTDRLEEAVAAYRDALEEYTRERVPLDWATTQNNLGNALRNLGERETGTDRLEEAVTAYRAALEEWTRDRVPLQWATTQNNLGNALATLGEREGGTKRLEEAVAAYHAALEEWTRDRVPILWAQTRENMAIAYLALFKKIDEAGHLDVALEAVDEALEVYREAKAEYYIEKAQRLRDAIIAARDGTA